MGSLTIHLVDGDQNPLSGKKVLCKFPVLPPTHSAKYTNEEGAAEFDDVPPCTVEVYVGGHLELEIGVGQNDAEDVTITI